MKCPHCGQEHPDNLNECPSTGKMLKRACSNEKCSYYGEFLFHFEKDICPCCGHLLTSTHFGFDFVDLGLSVKWATCNIGSMKPEEVGDFLAWGELEPKEYYDSSNYKFRAPKQSAIVKYNNNPRSKYRDDKFILEFEDDVATVKWGAAWRIPTFEEWEELIENCKWKWTSYKGAMGYKITSKKSGYKNVFIFLPAAGFRNSYFHENEGRYGYYWSSSVDTGYQNNARSLFFIKDIVLREDDISRCTGLSVRPVLEIK